ncbi:ribonuclease Z [Aphomia sociella]
MYGKSVFRCRVVSYVSVRNYKNNNTKRLLEFLAEMPKVNTPRITEAQRQRQNISKKSEKYGPSTVYLQVLGSGARGAPNTLYLFTDQKRYLFNCGECTQRLAHEHKVKLSRLEHIFITSKTWRNIGGLPGLSLTLQDVGVPNITLHGPEGLDELYNATRRFVIMKDMNVTMAKCSPSEDFEDNVMNVKYVLLGPHDDLLVGKDVKPAAKKPKLDNSPDREFDEFTRDDTDYYRRDIRNDDFNKNNKMNDKAKTKPSCDKGPMQKKTEKVLHELQKKTHCSVAYICTLKKRLGTLDLAKCVELGVKPGPLLGQLKNGQDVVLPDGTLVLSKDVKTPDDPGPVFIVMEVPDLSYLKESEFSAHFDDGVNPPENIPRLVVHYTPPHVFHHPTYQSFMSRFGPTTRHAALNSQNSCLGSEAVHRTQHKLHLLDADIFPLLRDASLPAMWNSQQPLPKTDSPIRLKGLEELKNKIALAQFQNIINMEGSCKGDGGNSNEDESNKLEIVAGRTLTIFHLRPKNVIDRSLEPKLHIQDYIQETMDVDGFVSSLEHFRRQVDSMRYAKSDTKEYPKVVFLGTGSCIPSKTRNTSAIVLQIDENRSMLMDCGEGTYGQLVRFYGPKRVNAFLRTLKAIYVSHLHADHHIGLIGVLQARREAFEGTDPDHIQPVHLLAPGQIVTWLSLYDQQFERIRPDFTLIPNQTLTQDTLNQNNEMTSAVLASIGVQQIKTCFVSHCPNAFGVAIDVDGQHKITYSGDTIPCDELAKIGENSSLLIHEATMEDELADEARTKMHSTTSQAIEMGRRMSARYTLLTHFSQRYARLPRLNSHILNDNNSVGIAFDNMQITMGDLELLPHMYAPLQLMFAEHCVEMELKAAHRARHKDRRSSPSATTDGTASKAPTHELSQVEKGTLHNRESHIRKSQAISSCRATESAPTRPRALYRESNASRTRSGYGKPLVTSLNNKLTIMRENTQIVNASRFMCEDLDNRYFSKGLTSLCGRILEGKDNIIGKWSLLPKGNVSENKLRALTSSNVKSGEKSAIDKLPLLDKLALRDILTELKQPLYKDMPTMGRLSPEIYSNRSFKPQLEDIKSSYLLLNKKIQEKSKANVDEMKTGLTLHSYSFARVTNYTVVNHHTDDPVPISHKDMIKLKG